MSVTAEDIQNILKLYSGVREARLKNDEETANRLSAKIDEDPKLNIRLVSGLAELAQMLLDCPIVFMKLLMTLVYLKTFKGKFSKKMKDQLLQAYGEGSTDNQNLQSSVPEISFEPTADVKDVANSWYKLLGKSYPNLGDDFYDKTIGQFVRVANLVVGKGVGDRALIAAQNAVWASSSATLLTIMGCRNNLITNTPELCAAIDQAANDLLKPVPIEN